MILNSFQDSHARVRWAAINAIGQLSTDLGPDLQQGYHQQVLPALINAMDDFQSPRVQVGHQLLDGWYSTSSLIPVALLYFLDACSFDGRNTCLHPPPLQVPVTKSLLVFDK